MFGPSKSKAKRPVEIAPRNFQNERLLCESIAKLHVVTFRYKDDVLSREFEPAAVYHSANGKVCVSGEMTKNPNDPTDRLGPHNFEVGLMSSITVTLTKYIPDNRFNRYDPKYRNGIICSV